MSHRMEAGLKTLVLALYDEAALTAVAKGLTGAVGQLAALRETASLASGQARRPVSEAEVLRVVLRARRVRPTPSIPVKGPVEGSATVPASTGADTGIVPFRLRRGRLAALAMRSLARDPAMSLS